MIPMIMITNLIMIYCCCDYVIKVLAFIQKEPFTNSKVGSVAALATLSLNLICAQAKTTVSPFDSRQLVRSVLKNILK